ncbi:MAG: type IV pilus assembly protein PilM [Acidobacteriota bacterium]|nr:type IV pilus assembly protein PilM [Acidobacteriota bacterium]
MPDVIGLDLGTSAVRAAELDLSSRVPALTAFSQVGLPPGTMVDGEVRDHGALSDAIRRLWANGGFTSTSVVVGIAGLRAITRQLDIPFVPDDEVDSAVRFQSEEVIPFSPDRTLLSAQVLGDTTTPEGAKTRRVLVAAAHDELVQGVVSAVEDAGLTVEGVDLVSSALVRSIVDPASLPEQPEAIVSIGAGLTVIVVHEAGRPLFVRTVGTGGNAATEAIAHSLDLPLIDAENMKRHMDGSTPQLKAAQRAVGPVAEELVSEIRNSLQYFASMPDRAPLTRLVVTGGAMQLQGLIEQLKGELALPVQEADPFARLDITGLEVDLARAAALAPVVATAVGLVLPEPNPSVRKFNLVPPEVLRRAFERKVTRYTIMGAVAVAALAALFGGWKLWSVHEAEGQVASLTTSVGQLNAEIPTYNKVVAAIDELQSAKSQVGQLTAKTVDWAAVLSGIDSVAPQGLGITSVIGTGGPAIAGAGGSGASATASSAGSNGAPAAAGSIGTVTVAVSGSFPNTAHFSPVAQWIDAISGTSTFAPPSVSAVTNAPNGSATNVTFQSVVSILPPASLEKNGSY